MEWLKSCQVRWRADSRNAIHSGLGRLEIQWTTKTQAIYQSEWDVHSIDKLRDRAADGETELEKFNKQQQ